MNRKFVISFVLTSSILFFNTALFSQQTSNMSNTGNMGNMDNMGNKRMMMNVQATPMGVTPAEIKVLNSMSWTCETNASSADSGTPAAQADQDMQNTPKPTLKAFLFAVKNCRDCTKVTCTKSTTTPTTSNTNQMQGTTQQNNNTSTPSSKSTTPSNY